MPKLEETQTNVNGHILQEEKPSALAIENECECLECDLYGYHDCHNTTNCIERECVYVTNDKTMARCSRQSVEDYAKENTK